MDRAFSLLTVKAVNEDQRIIEGVASTPVLDRDGEILEPLGAKFSLPLPLLWFHRRDEPVGNVEFAKASSDGITFRARLAKINEPGQVKDLVDRAWHNIKAGLVRGVSVGLLTRRDSVERLANGVARVKDWEWIELSLCTIPSQQQASILAVKSIFTEQAASGRSSSFQIILPPGVSGLSKPPVQRGLNMTTVSERIATLDSLRGQKAARIDEVMQKSISANRTTDETERTECLTLKGEIEVIDADLSLLRFQETSIVATLQPVNPGPAAFKGAVGNSPARYYPEAKAEKPAPGIRLARVIRCKALARVEQADVARIAEREYGTRDPWLVEYVKAGEVAALSTTNLGDGLIPAEVGLGDFAEFLRPMTITGQFGAGGIPGFRRVGFRSGLASVTSGSTAYWVGELKPKPLTQIDTTRAHLLPLKIAALLAVSMETLADSSPDAEAGIRDDMAQAVVQARDVTFIDPSVTASAGVSPASITNDQDAIVSSGTDSDAVLLDLRSLFAKFDAANNRASQAVLVMSTGNARALSFMMTAVGPQMFPGMSANGGNLNGVPVIASDYAEDTVALISAGDVLYADDGAVRIDMSTEASLEMKNSTNLTQHGDPTATGAASVSMFQINGVAFRAEQRLNWVKRRDVVAPYLTSVAWGEAVNAS